MPFLTNLSIKKHWTMGLCESVLTMKPNATSDDIDVYEEPFNYIVPWLTKTERRLKIFLKSS